MKYLFDPPPPPALPIAGSDALFPVHRIYCIGRNYAEHVREMGSQPDGELAFFQKNADSANTSGVLAYPGETKDLHHEIELVVALGSGGTNLAADGALKHVFGYAVGLDMTRRDLQAQAKKLGRSWEAAKAFDGAAPLSAIVPAAQLGHPVKGAIWLDVNGVRRQNGDLAQMIHGVGAQLSALSRLFELKAGDLIFTGTPAGVGPVVKGDRLHGHIDGVGELELTIV